MIKENILLNSVNEPAQTEITDKTDCPEISNRDFLFGIFGKIKTEKPITVSFKGNPNTADKAVWFGQAYDGNNHFSSETNNYTSLSVYKPDQKGNYRRKKECFAACHAIVFDDVGTKVIVERITLAPSWIIETSAGNFQYGYIFDAPIKDAALATNLLDSVIAAGLCDKGASGATARLCRLPAGINGKHGFNCMLTQWQPDRRYSVQQIVDGLQIELKDKNANKANAVKTLPHDDEIHIVKPDQHPVIAALHERNFYKQPLGDNKHDITCPWVHEHTDQVDHGTVYFEPSEDFPIGGFKCQHGHCAERRVKALHDFLGITSVAAKNLPIIKTMAGELNKIVSSAEIELSNTGRHYQRGGIIVTISTDPQTQATNVKALSAVNLTRVLAGIITWMRFDKREQGWLVCDPPERHVKMLHDSVQYPHLPVLNGIARQPHLRADGSLVTNAGYDAMTGLFGVFNPRDFNVPDNPSHEQAQAAAILLDELISEFTFKNLSDKAATLSAIIAATIRQSLHLCPMYHVAAPQIASGKSYLCELLSLFATPEKPTPHSFPSDDEEMRKMLLAELLTAPAVIEFDNLTTDLIPHKSLCTALTSAYMSGRILGQSKTAEVNTRALFLSSGNNVNPVRDMTRRTVTIRLDPQCETPAIRDFKHNPVLEVRTNRGKFISAVLTIVRAWVVAGRPKTEVNPLNSYGEWSELCRQTLLWLGYEDPATSVFEEMANDPDREDLAILLATLESKYSHYSTPIKTIVDDCNSDSNLRDALPDFVIERDGNINKRKLGRHFKRQSGRVVNGLRLITDTSFSSNAARWKVEKTNTASVL